MLTAENIGNDAANCRQIFGAVKGPPSSTNEILKLRVPGNDRILGFCNAIPKRALVRDTYLVNKGLLTKKM